MTADGAAIRSERQRQGLSREALVAHADRSFSEKTLARAESGNVISRELLVKIARALGQADDRFIRGSRPPASSNASIFTIHHWDDEAREYLDLVTNMRLIAEAHFMCVGSTTYIHDAMTSMHYSIQLDPPLGFDIHYILYDNMAHFYEAATNRISSRDAVILDIMHSTGLGHIVPSGLAAIVELKNILPSKGVVFYSAFTDIKGLAGPYFDNVRFIPKESPDTLDAFLLERLIAFSQSENDD